MGEFEALGISVVALSQEDDDVEGFRKIGSTLKDLPFSVVGDVDRRTLPQLERTAAYYTGRDGKVLQVFPMETYRRAELGAIRHEILRLRSARTAPSR